MGLFDAFKKKALKAPVEEKQLVEAGKHVLVVDDASFMRQMIGDMLKKNGHEQIAEAEDGEKAVAAFKACRPYLVIMDTVMPNMGGLDACTAMGSIDLDVPVIISAPGEYAYEAFNAGAKDFLPKPFTPKMLMLAVDCALGRAPGDVPPVQSPEKKILIVDESDCMRAALKEILNDIGRYEIAETADGKTAVEMFKADRPDLVFSEMYTPGLDGVSLCSEMKRIDGNVPVIINSFENTEGMIIKAIKAGSKDYVLKPYNPERIEKIVRILFELQDLQPSNG